MGKKGKLEINLRFAMGRGRRKEIFLRFGGRNGEYSIVIELRLPYPILNVSCELVGSCRGYPAQSRVRIYTKLDETAISRETWVSPVVKGKIGNKTRILNAHCY